MSYTTATVDDWLDHKRRNLGRLDKHLIAYVDLTLMIEHGWRFENCEANIRIDGFRVNDILVSRQTYADQYERYRAEPVFSLRTYPFETRLGS